MFRPLPVQSSVILMVIALLTLSQFGVSSARSLELKDGYWSTTDDIMKRNSWWSKKSLDSATDYQRQAQEPAYDDIAMEATADRHFMPEYSSLFSCYIRDCVPKFVQCAQSSATKDEYIGCKKRHEMCGVLCGSLSTEDSLI